MREPDCGCEENKQSKEKMGIFCDLKVLHLININFTQWMNKHRIKLKTWSNMYLDGISRHIETDFEMS